MKKFITSLSLVLVAFAAQAQATATFLDLAAGSTPVSNVSYDFWIAPNDFHEYDFDIDNISNTSQDYKMRKVDMVMNNGASAYFCLVPGNCYAPVSPFTSPMFTITNTGSVELLCDFSAGANTGESSVRYTLVNNNNTNDTIFVVMNYHVTPAGVSHTDMSKVNVSAPSPNPAASAVSFSYTLAEGANNSFAVYNTLGELVKENSISESKGNLKLDVSDLNGGIYFVSFRINGEIVATRKVIVSH